MEQSVFDCMKPKVTDCTIYIYIYIYMIDHVKIKPSKGLTNIFIDNGIETEIER